MLRLIKIRQRFPRPALADVPGELRSEIDRLRPVIPSGGKVAVGVGSRGIAGLQSVVATVVRILQDHGAQPFVVPAMGSHGGATAEGQREVLASYGITEEKVGAPVRSSMETVELPQGDSPCRVFMDRHAWESDGVVLVNRCKVHTDFHGPHESGLVKMAVIGLGKQTQATEVHQHGVRGLRDFVPLAAREILASGKILFGVGLVENAYHELAVVRAVLPEDFHAQDGRLLEESRELMPGLPVEDVDVLLVDALGKDISGTGLDTNIIGRLRIPGEPEPESPRIKAIAVCDLTEASHGNALGMGLADVITRRLHEKIDLRAVAENVVTSSFLERGKMPIVAGTDREAFQWALRSCGPVEPEHMRVARIGSTLDLEELYVSPAIWREIESRESVEKIAEEADAFDSDGNLTVY